MYLKVALTSSASSLERGKLSSTCKIPARPLAAPQYRVPCHLYISGQAALSDAPALPPAKTASTTGKRRSLGNVPSPRCLFMNKAAHKNPALPYISSYDIPKPPSSGPTGRALSCATYKSIKQIIRVFFFHWIIVDNNYPSYYMNHYQIRYNMKESCSNMRKLFTIVIEFKHIRDSGWVKNHHHF
jgi:hypothetical protein